MILRRAMRVAEGKVTILTLLLNPDDRRCDFRLPTPHLPSAVLLDSAAPEAESARSIAGADVAGGGAQCGPAAAESPRDPDERPLCPRPSLAPTRWLTDETRFRLWAPAQETVSVALEDGPIAADGALADGWFEAIATVRRRHALSLSPGGRHAGARSGVARAGGRCAWTQASWSIRGAIAWRNPDWRGRPWRETVAVRAACRRFWADFAAWRSELPRLAALGITAVELMPVNDFPGPAQLGLRRRAALCARCGLRHAGRTEGAGRRGARPRADDLPRRGLQSLRAGRKLPVALRAAVLSRGSPYAVGTGDRFPPARGARLLHRAMCSTG